MIGHRLNRLVAAVAAFLLVGCATVTAPAPPAPESRFVEGSSKNRLHYLEFGGGGDPVILLAGPGNTAWIYEAFGRDLARDFRVFALTRRGHGQSEMPEHGYDQATLVEDIRAFLDANDLKRVHLIGASTAGEEVTRFASKYPDRVGSVVYLDAAYDRTVDVESGVPDRPERPTAADRTSIDAYVAYLVRTRGVKDAPAGVLERNWKESVAMHADGRAGMKWGEAQFQEYMKSLTAAAPDYSGVRAPALAIYSVGVPEDRISRATPEIRAAIEKHRAEVVLPWRQSSIAQFRKGAGRGEVAELNALHHPFLHRPRETASIVRRFLRKHRL